MGEFRFDESKLVPLIKSVVAEVIAEMEELKKTNIERLVYSEAEAAAMLGLKQYQLRDLRLKGKISHTRIVGNRVRYLYRDLMSYLNRRREESQE